jgi:hypothetical protein
VRTAIETRRLILHPFESGDAEAAFARFGDAIIMCYTPTGYGTSVEQTKARLGDAMEKELDNNSRIPI